MSINRRSSLTLLLGAAFALPLMTTGCATHVGVGYRVYDPYYSDYHTWNDGEIVYYNRWLDETHRPHRDFRRLPREQQREYWTWRHNHGDRH